MLILTAFFVTFFVDSSYFDSQHYVLPAFSDLRSTNRQCFVSHDERRV